MPAGRRLALQFEALWWPRGVRGLIAVRNLFAWTFVLAVVVRLVYVFTLNGDASFFAEEDSKLYWLLSDDISGTLLTHTLRPPGYPLFLWALRLICDSPRFIAVVQAFVDAGSCVLIVRLGMFFSGKTALVAGLMSALSASFVIYSAQMLSDTVTMFFQTAAFLAVAFYFYEPKSKTAAYAGLLAGTALLFRPSILLLLPFMFAAIAVRGRSATAALAFALVSLAPISPVILRNYIVFDRIAVATIGGVQLTDGIDPLARQRQEGTPYWVTRDRNTEKIANAVAADPEKYSNPFVVDDLRIAVAREDMATIRYSTFALLWAEGAVLNLIAPATIGDPRVREMRDKPSFFATAAKSFWERAAIYLKASNSTYLAALALGTLWSFSTLALATLGFTALLKTNRVAAVLLFLPIVYCLAISGPIASAKYRLPMEAPLILLAAFWIGRNRRQTLFSETR
jgi:hypothetical protein